MSQYELRRVPKQRKLDSSGVLYSGLTFQHELRRVTEPSNVLVANHVGIWSASLSGTRSCKDWEHVAIVRADYLEREFMSNEKKKVLLEITR